MEPGLPEVLWIIGHDDLGVPVHGSDDEDVTDHSSEWGDSPHDDSSLDEFISDDSGYDTMVKDEDVDEDVEFENLPDVSRPLYPVVQLVAWDDWQQGHPPLVSGAAVGPRLGSVPCVSGLSPCSYPKRNREWDPSEQGASKRQRCEENSEDSSTSGTNSSTSGTSRSGPSWSLVWTDNSDSD